MEDDYTLHDYKVKLNDTISIVVKNSENESTDKDNITEEKEINEEKVENKEQETEELEEGSSLYYKIGDAIDCCNQRYGSWYETIIQKIVKKKEEILYIVESNDIPVPERFIRPRARRLISFDKLFIGQKVMINYNLEEPKEIGMWYDFTISKINVKRTFQKLNGILHISRYYTLYFAYYIISYKNYIFISNTFPTGCHHYPVLLLLFFMREVWNL